VDPATHTFQLKIKIPNGEELLRPGMYAQTELDLEKVNAIVVPYQAVLKLQGSNDRYVFINDGGVAKRVGVELGQRFDDRIEIISDEIKEGEELVVMGQSRLVDGVKIEVVE
jgi:multidrug efflux pump subunit AcrA (membrane-fusion protein)